MVGKYYSFSGLSHWSKKDKKVKRVKRELVKGMHTHKTGTMDIVVLILDGNSEIGGRVRRNLCICSVQGIRLDSGNFGFY